MNDYISREEALELLKEAEYKESSLNVAGSMICAIRDLPAADVRPVVLCRDCVNYVDSEEVNGEKMCVRDADWCIEDGCYYGFTEYPTPDWFCADGKKKEDEDNVYKPD